MRYQPFSSGISPIAPRKDLENFNDVFTFLQEWDRDRLGYIDLGA